MMRRMPTRTTSWSLAWALPLALVTGCIPSRSGMGVVTTSTASRTVARTTPAPAPRAPRPVTPPVLAAPTVTQPPAGSWPSVPSLPVEAAPEVASALPAPAAHAETATRYVHMTGEACEAALRDRGVPFVSAAGEAPGVDRPIRLAGPLHGVEIHEPGPRSSWHKSKTEILDCRLALALDDLSAYLSEQGFVEIVQVSFYRQNARIARRRTPSQHAAGRAIDLSLLVHRDGTQYNVERDWGGAIGDHTCGPDAAAPRHPSPAAHRLRSLVCEIGSRGFVHLILTPNFNADHRNHFHIDLEPKRLDVEVK